MRAWWRRTTEHWRFKYLPPLVDALVAGSTFPARKNLKQIRSAILLDSNVVGHSVTHETAWVPTGPKKWGEIDIDTGYAARICVYGPESDSEIYNNVLFLPGLAHLAKKGRLEFCTSAELEDERIRQPVGRFIGYGSSDYNLFRDIRMRSVDGYAPAVFAPHWMGLPNAHEQQQSRLARADDALYTALVKVMGQKNNLDAWHICTAERQGMFCFLTMDFRLKRIVDANAHREPFRSLKTRIMTPVELGTMLGLMPVKPVLFSYHDASWFVRGDLHWPDNKRRPLSSYRRKSGDKNP